MRRLVVVASFFLPVYLGLTPPGLCPCWLMMDPREYHPHPGGQSERPHPHDYLFDLFQSQTVSGIPLIATPASLLIALQAASGLWRWSWESPHSLNGWAADPLTPPPRP